MIFVIFILAIASSTLTFPLPDQTQIKTDQNSFQQIPFGSSISAYEINIGNQTPRIVDQKDKVQPAVKDEAQVNEQITGAAGSVIETPQIQQVPVSVQKYSNVQLVKLEPLTSEIVLLGNIQQPVLLPYINPNQIQPLPVIPVKQNQSPTKPTEEATNVVIVPAFEPVEPRNIQINIPVQSQVPYLPPIQSIKIPHIQSSVPQRNISQVYEGSIGNKQNQVQTVKTKKIIDSQTKVEQTKNQNVKEEVQLEEKSIIPESSSVKYQVQAIPTSQVVPVPQQYEKANSQQEVNAKDLTTEEQSSILTQSDGNASQTVPQIDQQSNQRQFNIKEEIQKAQEEAQQEVISSVPITGYQPQGYHYQGISKNASNQK